MAAITLFLLALLKTSDTHAALEEGIGMHEEVSEVAAQAAWAARAGSTGPLGRAPE